MKRLTEGQRPRREAGHRLGNDLRRLRLRSVALRRERRSAPTIMG